MLQLKDPKRAERIAKRAAVLISAPAAAALAKEAAGAVKSKWGRGLVGAAVLASGLLIMIWAEDLDVEWWLKTLAFVPGALLVLTGAVLAADAAVPEGGRKRKGPISFLDMIVDPVRGFAQIDLRFLVLASLPALVIAAI